MTSSGGKILGTEKTVEELGLEDWREVVVSGGGQGGVGGVGLGGGGEGEVWGSGGYQVIPGEWFLGSVLLLVCVMGRYV